MSDVDPTINGVGGEGFAVDGTDSFAIAPALPPDAPDGGPPPNRRGLFVTVATGLVLLLVVVIAGSAGGDDDQAGLRGEDVETSDPERSTTTTESTEDTDPEPDTDQSGAISGDDLRSPDEATIEFDEAMEDTTLDELEDFDEFDDFNIDDFDLGDYEDDFDDFTDDDFSSSGSGRYLPRRVPYVPSTRRPPSTVPPWYRPPTTTTATTTATVPEETTTTTSSSATTTTTLAPDTTPPALAITGPTGTVNDPTPTISGTSEDGATVTVSEGSTLCTATAAGGTWACDSTQLGEGAHSISVTAIDAAGNGSAATTAAFTIDLPPAPAVIARPIGITNETRPWFVGMGATGSIVSVSGLAGVICSAAVVGEVWSCQPATDIVGGSYSTTARDAGGSTAGTSVTVSVEARAPVIHVPANGSAVKDTTPTFVGTGQDGSTVTLAQGGATVCTSTVTGGRWECTPTTPVATGALTFTPAAAVTGTPPVNGTPVTITIEVAASVPVIRLPADGGTVSDTTPTFSGSGINGSTVLISEGATPICTAVVSDLNWTCDATAPLAEENHRFTPTAFAAGARSTGPTVTLTVDAP